jgi:hypothetical protein
MTSIREVRAQAEAEALHAESEERVARIGGTNNRYWIAEIP